MLLESVAVAGIRTVPAGCKSKRSTDVVGSLTTIVHSQPFALPLGASLGTWMTDNNTSCILSADDADNNDHRSSTHESETLADGTATDISHHARLI